MKHSNLLVGLVTPEVLEAVEQGSRDVQADWLLCDVLEIRYDLFPRTEDWPGLAQRVAFCHPKALRLATIRLQCDGGKWPNPTAPQRIPHWQRILQAPIGVHLLDLEMDYAHEWPVLSALAPTSAPSVILSRHYFDRIPSETELETAITLCQKHHGAGFKVACMAVEPQDTAPLYPLIRRHAPEFDFFSLFAMGRLGQASRLYSLTCGANLTYGAILQSQAPGQIPIRQLHQLRPQIPLWSSESQAQKALEALS